MFSAGPSRQSCGRCLLDTGRSTHKRRGLCYDCTESGTSQRFTLSIVSMHINSLGERAPRLAPPTHARDLPHERCMNIGRWLVRPSILPPRQPPTHTGSRLECSGSVISQLCWDCVILYRDCIDVCKHAEGKRPEGAAAGGLTVCQALSIAIEFCTASEQ